MNDTMTLRLPQGLGAPNVTDMLAFPGSVSEKSAKHLTSSAVELMRNISMILEDLLISVIKLKSGEEFQAARKAVFPQYFDAIRAFSVLARIVVQPSVLDRVSWESFSEMEAELGAEVRDQAMFTLWTLRKIHDLCRNFSGVRLADHLKETDAQMCSNFITDVVWAQFHLSCLTKSMELRLPIYPEVKDVVIDGLRAAVNAYAWARRGLDLRVPKTQPIAASVEWDDEEQELLNESTYDMLGESA
jgi:hypothetical protein